MTFCPVTRSVDEHLASLEDKPWSGRVRITLSNIPDTDTVIECEFELDDASSEESVIAQIREIIAHQTSVEIL